MEAAAAVGFGQASPL